MVTSYATILPPGCAHHQWQYCYLHGLAEDLMAQYSDEAPDTFSADMPMPTKEGNHIVSIFGQPALAVIRYHYDILSARIALVEDNESLLQALDYKSWR